jgi:hypothetical protein
MSESPAQVLNPEPTFEVQVEAFLAKCTPDQLKYVADEVKNELSFRNFSQTRITTLRKQLQDYRAKFYLKMIKDSSRSESETEEFSAESTTGEESYCPKKCPS